MKRRKIKVLIVCFADSSHSQDWVKLLADHPDIDVRVYAHNVSEGGMYSPQTWQAPTYVLKSPDKFRGIKAISLFSNNPVTNIFSTRITNRLPKLNNWYLTRIVNKWQPDIVHALSIIPAGVFAWNSLEITNKPIFIVSSWGSDIFLGKDRANDKEILKTVLSNCDGFLADCRRDIGNAIDLGLKKDKVAFDYGVPVTGGIDVENIYQTVSVENKNIILIPKAYEGTANKTLPIIEALNLLGGKLDKYEIHLLMTSEEVKLYIKRMPLKLQKKFHIHPHIEKTQVLDLMKQAKILLAPSVSDGTPLSMLEAMAVGTFPIMSPLESIKEWIKDGENGFLVHPLYPDKIAEAINKVIENDDLCNSAATINRKIIETKANREKIRLQVAKYYMDITDKVNINY